MRKQIREPWLGWIIEGLKTYEGRLNRGDWAKLRVGDRFVAYDQREVTLEVTGRLIYPDFGEVWAALGRALIPVGCHSIDEARSVYAEFYPDHDVRQYQVVALGVRVV